MEGRIKAFLTTRQRGQPSSRLPAVNRRTLEVLRQPLEDGTVTISRALNSTTFPANFMLIAALNPCPYGYRGDSRRNCNCTSPPIEHYMSKIAGNIFFRSCMTKIARRPQKMRENGQTITLEGYRICPLFTRVRIAARLWEVVLTGVGKGSVNPRKG